MCSLAHLQCMQCLLFSPQQTMTLLAWPGQRGGGDRQSLILFFVRSSGLVPRLTLPVLPTSILSLSACQLLLLLPTPVPPASS